MSCAPALTYPATIVPYRSQIISHRVGKSLFDFPQLFCFKYLQLSNSLFRDCILILVHGVLIIKGEKEKEKRIILFEVVSPPIILLFIA